MYGQTYAGVEKIQFCQVFYVIFHETWYKHPPPTWNVSR